jgi:hypothetical protein
MYYATTRQVLLDGWVLLLPRAPSTKEDNGNNSPLFPRAVFSGILKREFVAISGALTSSKTNII